MFLINQSFSQKIEMGNFIFDKDERTISWVKVFEPEIEFDINSLKSYFQENKILEIKSSSINTLKGEFIKRPIDLQKYGYSRGKTPMVLIDVEQFFDFSIELREGRYRVILTNLGYVDNGVISDIISKSLVGNTGNTAKGNFESYNGEFSFTKENDVRKRINPILELLDLFYSDMLSFKQKESLKEDW